MKTVDLLIKYSLPLMQDLHVLGCAESLASSSFQLSAVLPISQTRRQVHEAVSMFCSGAADMRLWTPGEQDCVGCIAQVQYTVGAH